MEVKVSEREGQECYLVLQKILSIVHQGCEKGDPDGQLMKSLVDTFNEADKLCTDILCKRIMKEG